MTQLLLTKPTSLPILFPIDVPEDTPSRMEVIHLSTQAMRAYLEGLSHHKNGRRPFGNVKLKQAGRIYLEASEITKSGSVLNGLTALNAALILMGIIPDLVEELLSQSAYFEHTQAERESVQNLFVEKQIRRKMIALSFVSETGVGQLVDVLEPHFDAWFTHSTID